MIIENKPRNYRGIWLASLLILFIGVLLTINMALIRPLGYALLFLGGVGLVWSLIKMK